LIPERRDYRFCESCQVYFDFWKYDDLASAGHEGCRVREVTEEEYRELLRECREAGCY
jgi:hypothetical protein